MTTTKLSGRSLRHRLLLSYGAIVALAVVVLGALAVIAARVSVADAHFQRLTSVAAAVSSTISELPAADRLLRMGENSTRTRANFENDLTRVRDATEVARIRLLSPDFRTMADTDGTTFGADAFDLRIDQAEIESVLRGEKALSSRLARDATGTPVMRGYAPIRDEASAIVAFVAVDGPADLLAPLYVLTGGLMLSGVLLLALLLGVTTAISRRITAPITGLVTVAERVEQGEYDGIGESAQRSELLEVDRLTNALISMGRTLQRREEDQQMMVAGIAHEIRNPLAGLRLRVDMLAQDDAVGDRAVVDALHCDVDHLERVVEEFLQWTRRESPTLTRVSMSSVVATVVGGLKGTAADRHVTLEADADAWPEVAGDEGMVRSILHNVVLNAIQASASGGRVQVWAGGDASGDLVCALAVSDVAGGMSDGQISDALKPFFTTKEKGTGLGLPLSRRMARLLGGRLDVRSEAGVGTTVRLYLGRPADDAPARAERVARAIDVDDGNAMIG